MLPCRFPGRKWVQNFTPVPPYYCAVYAVITQVWNPCAPLLMCTVGAMVTQVWNPCAPLLLCTVGSDTQVWNPCTLHYCAL